ncbi:heterokaryon incompatibility protein-domain-containing protein [Lasiosphaeria hispida]|uniref:Heterokaryon incompatibility protein-domain-containing protein n=1 Tax=Lasiosphaeria hispida TaxID=260671 RepID=A0AAJ0HWS7_9PEZI|nr:heterokaryon incompatibility protein-domain-containing protein [Lasiosphaeria hispida]
MDQEDGTRPRSAGSPRYPYSQLQPSEIRILVLFPSLSASEPLRGTLVHTMLAPPAEIPKFRALSYTWGSPENPEVFHVQDGQVLSQLPMGKTLASALRQLRPRFSRLAIWVDALCINQDDLGERASQVLRMGDIYTLASRVVVWLGEASEADGGSTALRLLASLSRFVDLDHESDDPHMNFKLNPKTLDRRARKFSRMLRKDDTPISLSAEEWQAIKNLLSRSWFQRVWVWQEVTLGRKTAEIFCGKDSLSWARFVNSIMALGSLMDEPYLSADDMKIYRSGLDNAVGLGLLLPGRFSPERIFWNSRLCQCTDDRDRVYAMLGLHGWGQDLEVTPDYTLSKEAVYKDLVGSYLKTAGYLDILSICQIFSDTPTATLSEDPWPSWVPDFSRLRELPEQYRYGEASGTTKAVANFLGGNKFQVAAVSCSTVASRLSARGLPLGASRNLMRKWVIDLALNQLGTPDDPRWEDGTADKLADALMAGGTRRTYKSDATIKDTVGVFRAWVGDPVGQLDLKSEGSIEAKILNRLGSIPGRYCFQTDDGSFITGPPSAREGDIVYVVLGCRRTLLLRPVRVTGMGQPDMITYRIVGACYHRAYSAAEALLGPMPDGWQAVPDTSKGEVYFIKGNPFEINDADDGNPSLTVGPNVSREDPRLGGLPPGWQEKAMPGLGDDMRLYWEREDGSERTFEHPRASARILMEERGVGVEMVTLV